MNKEQIKEKPILFSTEMVKAILEGRKTQTRRIIKPQPESGYNKAMYCTTDDRLYWTNENNNFDSKRPFVCPCQIGQTLWVRETWSAKYSIFDEAVGKDSGAIYKADPNVTNPNLKWKPSIFMPKKYARIWLEVTDVRIERLQDITIADAYHEGIELGVWSADGKLNISQAPPDFKNKWIKLWDSINEKRGYGWDRNPYVWVLEFKRI